MISKLVLETREANTCADSSIADLVVQSYSPSGVAHILDFVGGIVATNTQFGTDWQIQSQSFRAWSTAQPFTSPLFRMVANTGVDYRYTVGEDINTPPVPPAGWTLDTIDGVAFAYVYATQACGSVPLMGVSFPAAEDHWYTTNVRERDDFVSAGWVDEGVVAFVLPL